MPSNKEAFIRYKIIDNMLRNKHKPFPSMLDFIDTLEEKLGKAFSESTIQKDIKAMKEDELLGYKAPIKYSKRHRGYRYTDPNFTLAEIPLGDEDIASIEFAATVLQQYKDVRLFKEFGAAVDKIFNAVNISSVLDEKDIAETIQFEQVPYFKGSELIGTILAHIKEREVIKLIYQKFDNTDKKTHIIHPYLLKEYRNRWYLIGMLDKNDRIITLGLDRILKTSHSEEKKFRFHTTFSPKEYFQHAYGITTFEGKPEKIELSLTPWQGAYIKTQPLHSTQKVVSENENEIIISLEVGITIELVMTLLSFGAAVKVLSPASLQETIKEKLQETLGKY